jgi:hypothetical protein
MHVFTKMADNGSMKTKTLITILSLLVLVSCNPSDDGGTVTYRAPVGTLNKLWTGNTSTGNYKVESIDLSDPNNIIVLDVTHIKVLQKPSNGMPGRQVVTTSDCVYSSPGEVMVNDFGGYFETTLVSGDPIACNQYVPKMNFKHYGFEEGTDEFLIIVGGSFK